MAGILGFVGSFISFILFIPQARTVWRQRHDPHALRGASLGTQFIVIANALVWFAYAYVLGEFWVGAAGFVNLPLALFTIALILRARRREERERVEPCVLCAYDRGEHLLLLTQGSRRGQAVPCAEGLTGVGVAPGNVAEVRRLLEILVR